MQWIDRFWHQTLRVPFRLSHRSYGDGAQPIILIHGVASRGDFWQPLITELIKVGHYRVIVPDLLGHGTSPTPSYIDYSVDDQVRAVKHLLRQLGIRRAMLVGHSMGCLVATRFAHHYPEKTSRLLLYEPPLFADVPEFATHRRRQDFYRRLYERIAANPPGKVTVARLVARISKNWQAYLTSDQAWQPIAKSLRNTILAQSSYEELRDITVQTDIIHGRLDVVVPPQGLQRQLAQNKNITFYRTTTRHRLSTGSARRLANIIASESPVLDTKDS